jgi:mRNA interferase MazF
VKERDVILVPLPQSDGLRKPRPAIILKIVPPFGDYLVCGVSSQLRQQVPQFDDLIMQSDADFGMSGLRTDSLIRIGFLAIYTKDQVLGSIGEISVSRHRRLRLQLANFLVSEAGNASQESR